MSPSDALPCLRADVFPPKDNLHQKYLKNQNKLAPLKGGCTVFSRVLFRDHNSDAELSSNTV